MKIENTNLEVLARNVAASLGLSVVTTENGPRIFTGTPGRQSDSPESYFFFRLIDHARRIEVCGNFHLLAKTKEGGQVRTWFGPSSANSPTITVSASRSSEAIAQEITRRFLPAYSRTILAAQATRDQQDAHRITTQNLKFELEKAFGADSSIHTSFEVFGAEANITARGLSRENALKLAAFLKTLNLNN